jgi:hypothetical protein
MPWDRPLGESSPKCVAAALPMRRRLRCQNATHLVPRAVAARAGPHGAMVLGPFGEACRLLAVHLMPTSHALDKPVGQGLATRRGVPVLALFIVFMACGGNGGGAQGDGSPAMDANPDDANGYSSEGGDDAREAAAPLTGANCRDKNPAYKQDPCRLCFDVPCSTGDRCDEMWIQSGSDTPMGTLCVCRSGRMECTVRCTDRCGGSGGAAGAGGSPSDSGISDSIAEQENDPLDARRESRTEDAADDDLTDTSARR